MKTCFSRWIICLGLLMMASLFLNAPANASVENRKWNGAKIDWYDLKHGLMVAKHSGKPIFMVIHTTWCPHCKTYSKAFFNRRVEKLAKKFVFVLVDQDRSKSIARYYAPDGQYIPRTMILTPDGELDASMKASRRAPAYFIDPESPYALQSYLQAAIRKYRRKR